MVGAEREETARAQGEPVPPVGRRTGREEQTQRPAAQGRCLGECGWGSVWARVLQWPLASDLKELRAT